MENIDIKDIVKNKTIAKFDYAVAGVLYYTTETPIGKFQFPVDMNDKDDVGTARFESVYSTITLMRYVRKAIESGELIKIG